MTGHPTPTGATMSAASRYWREAVRAASVLGVAAWFLLPGLSTGPSLDASVFEAIGWRVSAGDGLYSEAWDHKPPGAYLVTVVGHGLVSEAGRAWLITWLVSVATTAGSAWLVYQILRSRGIGSVGAVAGLLTAGVLSSYLLSLGGGMGETLAVFPATAAVAVAAISTRRERWLLAGLLAGAAVVISIQLFSVAAILLVLAAWSGRRHRLVHAAALAVGGLTSVGAATAVVVAAGLGPSAWDAIVRYSSAYRAAAGGLLAASLVPWIFLVVLPLVIPAALAALRVGRHAENRDLIVGCIAWLGAGVLGIVVQGRFYGHYAVPLVIPLGILAGLGLRTGFPGRLSRIQAGLMFGVPLAAAIAISVTVGALGARMEQARFEDANARVAEAAPVVAAHAPVGDSVFVWGNQPRLYEIAHRRPAVRYLYLYPLLTDGYVSAELIAELLDALVSDPPAVIVDAGSPGPGQPGFPPLLIARPTATDGRDTDMLDPLRAFVADRYRSGPAVGGWQLYLRAESS